MRTKDPRVNERTSGVQAQGDADLQILLAAAKSAANADNINVTSATLLGHIVGCTVQTDSLFCYASITLKQNKQHATTYIMVCK